MRVNGEPWHTVWLERPGVVGIIDQRALPFRFVTAELSSVSAVAQAICDMWVRGAGCIGGVAAWGMYLAARQSQGDAAKLRQLAAQLSSTRPTAVNLAWAVQRQLQVLQAVSPGAWEQAAQQEAAAICAEDVAACVAIGRFGHKIFHEQHAQRRRPGEPLQILTHCNAGWLAFVDYGSATAPIYAAHDAGLPLHVWVDETRPRNQGARLTAWELAQHGVPHTVITDNAGGHLMQRGQVDLVITGADRVTRRGDVANKIGTYLKALAARDTGIPFYVALPTSTLDWTLGDGLVEIPIEERSEREVTHLSGVGPSAAQEIEVAVASPGSAAANPAFDVTPARLITALITERGIAPPSEQALAAWRPT